MTNLESKPNRAHLICAAIVAMCGVLVAANPAAADPAETCSMPAGGIHRYFPPEGVVAPPEPQPNPYWTPFLCSSPTECRLKGWLYKPTGGAGHRPAIVFFHGSGKWKDMTDFCEMVSYFVNQGYVVFVPYPRGYHDKTPGHEFHNTGTYIGDLATDADSTLAWMATESLEMDYALKFLAAQKTATGEPLVDVKKIALLGHSWGGATVALMATVDFGDVNPAAIVDISGAVLSWPSNPAVRPTDNPWYVRLCAAARDRRVPMFFAQTTNESQAYWDARALRAAGKYDQARDAARVATAATVDVFACADINANTDGNHGAEAAVFTAVPSLTLDEGVCEDVSPKNKCAHRMFFLDHRQVTRWAPRVKGFLTHYGIH